MSLFIVFSSLMNFSNRLKTISYSYEHGSRMSSEDPFNEHQCVSLFYNMLLYLYTVYQERKVTARILLVESSLSHLSCTVLSKFSVDLAI